jgi:hypothetical protein
MACKGSSSQRDAFIIIRGGQQLLVVYGSGPAAEAAKGAKPFGNSMLGRVYTGWLCHSRVCEWALSVVRQLIHGG